MAVLGGRPGATPDNEGKIAPRMLHAPKVLARTLALAVALPMAVTCGAPSETHAAENGSCETSQGSLALLGCTLLQKLPLARGVSVAVVALKSDRELPAESALRERVRSAVAMALKATSPSGDSRKLRVELSVEKAGGVLRVTAELRRATGFWQRLRRQTPDAEQRAFVEVPLDAELRALIPPPPLVVGQTLKLKAPERGIVALACGPLGAEGAQELAIVTRSSVRVGRIESGAFVERKRVAWSSLSSVAAAPLREPIGSADITAAGTLRVGSSDRQDGAELSAGLEPLRRFSGLLPLPGGECVKREGLGLSAVAESCEGASKSISRQAIDAVAGYAGVRWGRGLGGTELIALQAGGAAPAALRVGAQLALGDADSDGQPELAFSADTLDTNKDKLSVVTLTAGKLTPRFELGAPDIRAIAICSRREGPGMAPIVVASGDELWLIR